MHKDTRTTPRSSGVANFEAKISLLFTEECLVTKLTKGSVKCEESAVYIAVKKNKWPECFDFIVRRISFSLKVRSPKLDVLGVFNTLRGT